MEREGRDLLVYDSLEVLIALFRDVAVANRGLLLPRKLLPHAAAGDDWHHEPCSTEPHLQGPPSIQRRDNMWVSQSVYIFSWLVSNKSTRATITCMSRKCHSCREMFNSGFGLTLGQSHFCGALFPLYLCSGSVRFTIVW